MLRSEIPCGLTISLLAPDDQALAKDCRDFCLRAIKDTYGYDYTPDWHADLDSLGEGDACQYGGSNRGAFFVVRDAEGRVIGTAGVRALGRNPGLATRFAHRYPDTERVAFNCRLYLAPPWCGRGIGRTLIALREHAARRMNYVTVYLHCDAKAERLRRYWVAQGFCLIGDDGEVAHYDKLLSTLNGMGGVR